jgi:DNA-binding CsgD family transcriptional regulator
MGKYRTEKEVVIDTQVSLNQLENGIVERHYSIQEIGELLPGMLHLNRSEDLVLAYFNTWALERFEKSVEEILEQGMEFMLSLFETDTAKLFSQSLLAFLNEKDATATHGFFQKLRFNSKQDFQWMYTSSKLFDDDKHVFSYSSPLIAMEQNSAFLLRTLDDNLFLRKNFLTFQSLSKREKEILKLVAEGNTSKQIAEMLFLSKTTISTHRRNIAKKLETNRIEDWVNYSVAFNL